MLKLSAFADEIDPSIDEQIRVCRQHGVSHLELRSVNKINVLDLDDNLRNEIRSKLRDNGMGVIGIGSPIGKVRINEPWQEHFDRFRIAVDAAEFFAAPLIRIFSYYAPQKGGDMAAHRDEVIRRMNEKVQYLGNRNITIVHENEKDIYGENGSTCLDLMKSVQSPKFRMAFDFANFVQAGDKPLDNWPSLKPYTAHVHIKDAIMGSGKVVPAGQGDGQLGPIIADAWKSGYRGFLSLEPHLKVAGHSHGETGPELFAVAVNALKDLCRQIEVPVAGA
jgi:3-dehydroshikimate dehydratase